MRSNVLLTVIFTIATFYSVCGQTTDSTDRFKLYTLESVSIKSSVDEETVFEGKSLRSSFLILDQQVRHCLLTVNLIEYKLGKKIRESQIFSKLAIQDNSIPKTFEDSTMVFSLYRKQIKDNQFIWGFRVPSGFLSKTIQLDDEEEYYNVVAIPQNFFNNKIPLGIPFPLIVITLPDKTRNFPFYKPENKNKYLVNEWSYKFLLKHTFVIELTIEKIIGNEILNDKVHSL